MSNFCVVGLIGNKNSFKQVVKWVRGVKFVSLDQNENKNKSLSRKITEYDIPLNTCLPYTLPLAF